MRQRSKQQIDDPLLGLAAHHVRVVGVAGSILPPRPILSLFEHQIRQLPRQIALSGSGDSGKAVGARQSTRTVPEIFSDSRGPFLAVLIEDVRLSVALV